MSNCFTCKGCQSSYKTERSLSGHWKWKKFCFINHIRSLDVDVGQLEINANDKPNQDSQTEIINANEETIDIDINDNCSNEIIIANEEPLEKDNNDNQLEITDDISINESTDEACIADEVDTTLIQLQKEHSEEYSDELNRFARSSSYKPTMDLLKMLKTANAPLYLYSDIMKWAQRCTVDYKYNFRFKQIPKRVDFMNNLVNRFDASGLKPKFTEIELPGAKCTVTITTHDFRQCLYSLLNDDLLLKEENFLLLNEDNIFHVPEKRADVLGDIDTGSVYRSAYQTYVKHPEKELLCPIIFFIDKTHTDVNGRLCLEPLRFTLGIFKRHVRNQPNAWRTLGYVSDQSRLSTKDYELKLMDYHAITKVILKSYIAAQKAPIRWNLRYKEKLHKVNLLCPVLFIVGDTEGHDKLVGKYNNRVKTARLCRYCNCPSDRSDDPYFKGTLYKKRTIETMRQRGQKEALNAMSFHCVENAWKDVLFCDNERGIYGATLAELMHCMQHGLHMYACKALFGSKKAKKGGSKKQNADEEVVEAGDDGLDEIEVRPTHEKLSRNGVFSDTYCKQFDKLCRKYGKYLSRQSDRSLPRTHFNTNYTSIARKTANEMTGIILVYLAMFAISEGQEKMDKEFGEQRATAFLHLLELMLMVENFCYAEEHSMEAIRLLKGFMPRYLHTFKDTVNRTEGQGMKLVKFHLPLHFASDMERFGSMKNFDSGIGESHHKSECKNPAQRTQRRYTCFEQQVANRQVENIMIDQAYDEMEYGRPRKKAKEEKSNFQFHLRYSHFGQRIYRRGTADTKWYPCTFPDKVFQKQLTKLCHKLVSEEYLKSPIQFFSYHKRNDEKFRANPMWKENDFWYDWVKIDWERGNETDRQPAKMLLFVNITKEQFLKPFYCGTTYVPEAGSYAIAYSFNYEETIPAHLESRLCEFGHIMTVYDAISKKQVPELCMFSLDCIADTCIAIPFHTTDDLLSATKWVTIKSPKDWYDIFFEFMKEKRREK